MADMNPTLAIKATTLKSNTKPASKSQNKITNPIPLWCYVVTTMRSIRIRFYEQFHHTNSGSNLRCSKLYL